ncbi:hypothetical protein NDA11_007029 [Ustilago hordei]|nr:hypothetical protein NDA10_002660 [Ustilago hordei]KAJ1586865.1 hypothetical protein NDA11_007029 [Ustilago hordei]KAJ1603223.1 hypothetical protein NDA14_004808 [Ustilago hordei]UTT94804.1 hypothetical protein NDA17_001153 [Ustilago hordei]
MAAARTSRLPQRTVLGNPLIANPGDFGCTSRDGHREIATDNETPCRLLGFVKKGMFPSNSRKAWQWGCFAAAREGKLKHSSPSLNGKDRRRAAGGAD